MAKGRQVTMREVASRAGVSVGTVSRALQNHPSIPAQTRQRIQRTASRLGYKPNPMVGALMTRIRSSNSAAPVNLACLYDTPRLSELSLGQEEFMKGLKQEAQRLGYAVEFQPASSIPNDGNAVARIWKARGIRGVVLSHYSLPSEDFAFPWQDFAWVVNGRAVGIPKFHRVANHIYQIVKLALKELHKRGYSRPGLAINFRGPNRSGRRWLGAFEANRLDLFPLRKRVPPFEKKPDLNNYGEWVKRYHPDVVLGLNDSPKEWLDELGYRVPEDIGFLHLGANCSQFEASGIRQNFFEVGQAAIHSLDSQLRRNELGIPAAPTSFAVDGSWHEGKTLWQP